MGNRLLKALGIVSIVATSLFGSGCAGNQIKNTLPADQQKVGKIVQLIQDQGKSRTVHPIKYVKETAEGMNLYFDKSKETRSITHLLAPHYKCRLTSPGRAYGKGLEIEVIDTLNQGSISLHDKDLDGFYDGGGSGPGIDVEHLMTKSELKKSKNLDELYRNLIDSATKRYIVE